MRYALILSFALLAACGQPENSTAESSEVNLAAIEPPIEDVEDLAGKKLVYLDSQSFEPEMFEASGKWSTSIKMPGLLVLKGSWRQDGLDICVDIEEGSSVGEGAGETVCRKIEPRPRGLFLKPIGHDRELGFIVERIR